jgi:hypothetical protein
VCFFASAAPFPEGVAIPDVESLRNATNHISRATQDAGRKGGDSPTSRFYYQVPSYTTWTRASSLHPFTSVMVWFEVDRFVDDRLKSARNTDIIIARNRGEDSPPFLLLRTHLHRANEEPEASATGSHRHLLTDSRLSSLLLFVLLRCNDLVNHVYLSFIPYHIALDLCPRLSHPFISVQHPTRSCLPAD